MLHFLQTKGCSLKTTTFSKLLTQFLLSSEPKTSETIIAVYFHLDRAQKIFDRFNTSLKQFSARQSNLFRWTFVTVFAQTVTTGSGVMEANRGI